MFGKITFQRASIGSLKEIKKVMDDVGYTEAFYCGKTEMQILDDLHGRFKNEIFLVAYVGILRREIIGFAAVIKAEDAECPIKLQRGYAYSNGIGVLKKYASKGIGSKLANFREDFLRKEGFKGFYTSVKFDNAPSLRIQEKLGMRKIGKYKAKYASQGKEILKMLFIKEFGD